jgi:hypothetical protein
VEYIPGSSLSSEMVFFAGGEDQRETRNKWISESPRTKVLPVFGLVRLHFVVVRGGLKAKEIRATSKHYLEE